MRDRNFAHWNDEPPQHPFMTALGLVLIAATIILAYVLKINL